MREPPVAAAAAEVEAAAEAAATPQPAEAAVAERPAEQRPHRPPRPRGPRPPSRPARHPTAERPSEEELAWAPPAAVVEPLELEAEAAAPAAAEAAAAVAGAAATAEAEAPVEFAVPPRRPREGRDIVPLPETGSVVRGVVQRLERYGAFVALEPKQVYRGLLHISQISDRRIGRVEDVLNVGDEVNVRVLEVDPRRGRISLGMRGVPQPWEEALQAAQGEEAAEGAHERAREGRPATLQDLADRFGREPAPAKAGPAPRTDRGAKEKEQLAAILRRLRGQ